MEHLLQIHFFQNLFGSLSGQWKLILVTLKIKNLSKTDSHKKSFMFK